MAWKADQRVYQQFEGSTGRFMRIREIGESGRPTGDEVHVLGPDENITRRCVDTLERELNTTGD